MSQVTVQQLPAQTAKLITSTQIITSVDTAVKELVENSIDAGAKVIQVRLENYGLDLIEVKDDGTGVSYDNVQKMFLPGFTSKIRQFEDLDNLNSYGFRGEALAALCKIANISITTKTHLDTLAMTYEIDSSGLPLSSKPNHLDNGTIITVCNLFSNIPVRRLFLSSKKKMSEELKKTEKTVQLLSLIHPELTVSLIHNKCPIWRKNSVKGIKQSFMQVAGLKTIVKMEYINKIFNEINLDLIVPKKSLENVDCIFSNSPHSMYVYVNKRPVNCKILSQPVEEHIFHHYSNLNIPFKYAICLVSVNLPPQQIDINLEPNKTKILLKNQILLIKIIDEALKSYYGHENFACTTLTLATERNDEESEDQPSKRVRLSSEKSVDEKKTEEFREKNQDWDVEIIYDDCSKNSVLNAIDESQKFDTFSSDQGSCYPQNLCSQINSNNSVLTGEEVSKLNTILSETNHKLLFSANSNNSETRLIDRNDIQSRTVEKKLILKEWPCRPKVIESQKSLTSLNEIENKAVEVIAEEMERNVKEWSTEMVKAIPNERNEEEIKNKNVLEEDVNQFDLSMQSISSQMGKKEMKAFTKFARIIRPKISEEFPNIKFTQVASIIKDRWKALTPDEVKYYEKMADVVDITRKIYQETKQNENLKPPDKPKNSSAQYTTNLKLMFENLNKKNKISRPPRAEILFPVSLNSIKKLREKPDKEHPERDIQIIGKLQPSGSWLYIKGNEIGHVRHQGLQELIVSQKMLNSFSVPRKALEKAIIVNEENLGTVLWNTLITLESEWDSSSNKYVITSDVVVKNGFHIEINKTEDIISSANIKESAEAIPHFGIPELKDVLRMYQKNGEFGGLVSWRPTSVYNYIINEAVRIAQQSVQSPDREEMEDMMNTYQLCFRHLPPLCLHFKEIFPSVFNLLNETEKIQET